jgi:hypothetical protein
VELYLTHPNTGIVGSCCIGLDDVGISLMPNGMVLNALNV